MEHSEQSTLPKKNDTSASTDIRKLFIAHLKIDQALKLRYVPPHYLSADLYMTRIGL